MSSRSHEHAEVAVAVDARWRHQGSEAVDQLHGGEKQAAGPVYAEGKYDDAARILKDPVANDSFVKFLTLSAYERID